MDSAVMENRLGRSKLRHALPRPLENGAHLSASEFLRRYEAMPEVKKAELIGGIVYMASPVRADQHGDPDSLMQGWLCAYAIATPGVKSTTNSTVRLGADDVPQPDGALRILPEYGGRVRLDAKGYLQGGPDLVVEVAASSASVDTHEKLLAYRRAGVAEYIVYRTEDDAVDWWVLAEDEYRPVPADEKGILRSKVFPGLWLGIEALVGGDGLKMMAILQKGLQSKDHAAFVSELHRRRTA